MAVAQVEGLAGGWAGPLSKGDRVGKEGQENPGLGGGIREELRNESLVGIPMSTQGGRPSWVGKYRELERVGVWRRLTSRETEAAVSARGLQAESRELQGVSSGPAASAVQPTRAACRFASSGPRRRWLKVRGA